MFTLHVSQIVHVLTIQPGYFIRKEPLFLFQAFAVSMVLLIPVVEINVVVHVIYICAHFVFRALKVSKQSIFDCFLFVSGKAACLCRNVDKQLLVFTVIIAGDTTPCDNKSICVAPVPADTDVRVNFRGVFLQLRAEFSKFL